MSAAITTALLAACGDDESEDADDGSGQAPASGTGTTATSEDEPSGDGDASAMLERVVIGLGADARTMMPNAVVDATTSWQLSHIFDTVLERDPDNNFEIGPWLAELTNIDDLTWELKIVNPDIKFHNGEPLDAEAIKAGLDFAQDPANESHYLERYAQISEIIIDDPLTLTLKTSEPFPIMPDRLSALYPIPPKYLEEHGAEHVSQNPIGTGPFKFVEWVRDERLVLERNPDYWHNDVMVNEVEFRYSPEFSSRLSALLAGEIDIIKDVTVDAMARVNDSGEARTEEIPSSRINYIALVNNREDSVFTDVRVRQAINYAVDVDAIIDGIFQGHATRMAGALSEVNPEVNPAIEPYPYDPDKALELFAEAGVDPTSLVIQLDSPQGRYPMDTDAAQAIAAELGKIGITVEVQYSEWGTHLDNIVNRRTGDMFYLGWGPALDAQGTLQFLFVGDSTYSGYGDPELEEKIHEAAQTVDPEARQALWDEIQVAVHEDAGWLFLWQQHDIYGVASEIDWKPRLDEKLWMGDAQPAP